MAILKIWDRANEFRIEIAGRFAGDCVSDIETAWRDALNVRPRQLRVDITRLTSYDNAGRKLLRRMYRHGTQIGAGTALSLVFLNEISSPERGQSPLLHEAASIQPLALTSAGSGGE